jgi:hypothetical protein
MSIKFYNALRFPAHRLFEFLDRARVEATEAYAQELIKWLKKQDITPDADGHLPEEVTRETLPARISSQAERLGRWEIYITDLYAYAIPLDRVAYNSAKEILGLAWAEDFQYWSDASRPENFTSAKWATRAHIWKEVLFGGNPSSHHLVYRALDFGTLEEAMVCVVSARIIPFPDPANPK